MTDDELERAHEEIDFQNFLQREAVEKIIIHDIQSNHTTAGIVLNKARQAAADAIRSLVEVDLFTRAGIEQARKFQAEVRRYRDLGNWLLEEIQAVEEAREEKKLAADRAELQTGDERYYGVRDTE